MELRKFINNKKQNTKKPKGGSKPQNKQKNQSKNGGFRLSSMPVSITPYTKCAEMYAIACVSPFNPKAQGACIPRSPALPSQKVTGFARFFVTAPEAAPAFAIWVCPTTAKDGAAIIHTSSTASDYTGQANYLNAANYAAGKLTVVYLTNLPYSLADQTPTSTSAAGAMGRIVSVGLSCRFSGTVFNTGGTYTIFASPNHETLASYSLENIQASNEASLPDINRSMRWVAATAITENELDYPTSSFSATEACYPYSQGQTVSLAAAGVLASVGAPILTIQGSLPLGTSSGATFSCQLVEHLEYTGKFTSAAHTPSDSDIVGFERVTNALSGVGSIRASNPNIDPVSAFIQSSKDALLRNMPMITNTVANAAVSQLKRAMSSGRGSDL